MQRIGEVHALFRPGEGFSQQGGVLDRDPRQPRKAPEGRRHLFSCETVNAAQHPFAFEQDVVLAKTDPASTAARALAACSRSSPVR